MHGRAHSLGCCQHILEVWDVSVQKELKNTGLRGDMSSKIAVVSVLLAAPERQAKSQTHFFILQKKKKKKRIK